MLSEKDEQALSDICTTFINSGDNVTLAHLLDFVTATIPDTTSPEWKSWTKYMERLNETWRQKNIDGEAIPWPEPPIQKKTSDSEPEEVIVLDVPIHVSKGPYHCDISFRTRDPDPNLKTFALETAPSRNEAETRLLE